MRAKLAIVVILWLFGLLTGWAQSTTWKGMVGDWFEPENWTFGVPGPGAAPTAVIHAGVALIDSGTADINVLYLSGTNPVSAPGLVISNGGLISDGIVVGSETQESGVMLVEGGRILALASVIVGASGTGTLNLSRSASFLTANLTVGANAGGTGTFELSGAGTNVLFYRPFGLTTELAIGNGGTGTLRILNGAVLQQSNVCHVSIGVSGGSGTLEVAGAGSSLHADMLAFGTGTIEARDGCSIVFDQDIVVSGTASFRIGQESLVSAGGVIALNEYTTVTFALHGDEADDYGLLSGAHLALDGVLRLTLADFYIPSLGDSFDVLNFSTVSGGFAAYDLPELAAGLQWDTSQLTTNGTLLVVPEPATCGLVLASCVVWYSRRRGRETMFARES
jgi:T5SS/PEP-CTERM-associated repeat protein